eukprot:TRINITY_DN1501_c0_g1_i2.p1 TRINITY_DN1501_c0_g1~~TRINITY_DN1501_c0_g1_i2.p1  ORF type:complete len:103 (-),score=7.23 TRINITY_DN1501_c0_g1_i2:599-907(-)
MLVMLLTGTTFVISQHTHGLASSCWDAATPVMSSRAPGEHSIDLEYTGNTMGSEYLLISLNSVISFFHASFPFQFNLIFNVINLQYIISLRCNQIFRSPISV